MKLRTCTVVLLISLASCIAFAADPPKPGNTGQDPTNPITRFDIRWENLELPDDSNNNDQDVVILRADAPIPLGKKGVDGTLAFRVDIPLVAFKGANPGDPGNLGFGSVYLQFLHIAPKKWGTFWGNKAWAWGIAAQTATATDGREENTYIGVLGAKWALNKTGSSFFTPVLKYYDGAAELALGYDAISEFHFQPVINFHIPGGVDFVTLWGNYDWVYTFDDGVVTSQESGDLFIPYDITVGKMLSGGKVVVSATFAGKLVNGNTKSGPSGRPGAEPSFDKQFQLRVGFFF